MTVGSVAADRWRKAMKMSLFLFRRGFNSSKCKTMAKMAVARVKLLRNKREVVIKQMRRDIALLLESGQDATARIRVEHVIREQNIMSANELVELFCELVVSRLSIIAKQRECPADLKEGISSLIFAGPRCSEIPELLSIRAVFQKKYGKDFVSAATDLRPNAGVNRLLIEKLSVKTPSGETKLKVLKEIAKEYQVQWDTTESEEELLQPPEQRIEGPNNFVSATSMPFEPIPNQSLKPVPKPSPELNNASNGGQSSPLNFQDLASAAGVAAEKALAAAEAAALLAACGGNQKFNPGNIPISQQPDYQRMINNTEYSPSFTTPNEPGVVTGGRKINRRQSYNGQRSTNIKFDESDCDEEIEMEDSSNGDLRNIHRRYSYNVQPARSNARYDESGHDDDEWGGAGRGGSYAYRPPDRPAPQVPGGCVHPKLPDYDTLAARFEALKHHNAQPK